MGNFIFIGFTEEELKESIILKFNKGHSINFIVEDFLKHTMIVNNNDFGYSRKLFVEETIVEYQERNVREEGNKW